MPDASTPPASRITPHSAANTHARSPLGTYALPLSPAGPAPHPPDKETLRFPMLDRSGPEHARLSSTRATARARRVRWSRKSGDGDEAGEEEEARGVVTESGVQRDGGMASW